MIPPFKSMLLKVSLFKIDSFRTLLFFRNFFPTLLKIDLNRFINSRTNASARKIFFEAARQILHIIVCEKVCGQTNRAHGPGRLCVMFQSYTVFLHKIAKSL